MVLTFSHGFDRKCLKDHFHFLSTPQKIFALLPVIPTFLALTETLLQKGFRSVFSAAGSHFLMTAVASESVEDMDAQFLYTAIFMERLRYTQDKTISTRIPIPGNLESNWLPFVAPCPPKDKAAFCAASYSQGKALTKAVNTISSQLSRDSTVGSSGIETNYGSIWKIIRVIEILVGFSR